MPRTPKSRVIEEQEVDEPTFKAMATVTWCFLRSGLEVLDGYFRELPSGPRAGRLTWFVRIKPRFRLPLGFVHDPSVDLGQFEPVPGTGGYRRASYGPSREHLTIYADRLEIAARVLRDHGEKNLRSLAELCRYLSDAGLVAVEHRHPERRGTSIWFPRSDVESLFLGACPADVAETVFVLASYDDPRKGIEAVRRLR
jgi:hypothetical protein